MKRVLLILVVVFMTTSIQSCFLKGKKLALVDRNPVEENFNTSNNDVVPSEHDITEKVEDVTGQPLIGVWQISDYSDSREVTQEERELIDENIEALKKVALLIFREDKTFTRAGFTAKPQQGTWRFDKEASKVYLIATSSEREEVMSLVSLTNTEFKMVIIEPVAEMGNVTTEISFTKKK